MRAFGYVRVSTKMQVESGLGIEAQKNSIDEYVKKINKDLINCFVDAGVSGAISLEKRPAMLSAISELKKGDVLVVAKRDRLGRDPLVLAMIEAAVQRKQARIISVAGEGTEGMDASHYLMKMMIDAFSVYERLIIKERVKSALKTKKNKGERVGHIPFGWKLKDCGILLEKNLEEQKILSEIHTLREKGTSLRETAETLNTMGILNRGNSFWNHASLHRIINNFEKHNIVQNS